MCVQPTSRTGILKWSLPSAVLFTNDSFGIEERQMDFVSRVYRRE